MFATCSGRVHHVVYIYALVTHPCLSAHSYGGYEERYE